MGYTGHELDAEVGIVNAKGRLFDPKLGRFLQVDPIQTDLLNGQRWNSYSYALNNPLRYTDPSGFDGDDGPVADLPNVSIGPRWDAHGQLDSTHMVEWHCTADGYSACVGMTIPAQPGESGTAQAGSAAEEASAPSAPGALDVAAAYVEGLAPSLGSAALGGLKQSVGMLLLPLTAPWEMTYGGVQRAQSLVRAYDRDGWSGVFWKAVASMPVLGSVSAAVDAYREAYALPMTDPRDQARAAGQITVPVAVAAVGVVGAAYGLAEGVGAVESAGVARGGAGRVTKLKPDASAQGPHSTFKRDPQTGKVTGHAEWDAQGNPIKRTDVTGADHGPVKTPHTHEYGPPNVDPASGKWYPGNEVNVRPATPDEIPK